MHYNEACEIQVTAAEAYRELRKQNLSPEETNRYWNEFQEEYGVKETYRGKDVLDFLGF